MGRAPSCDTIERFAERYRVVPSDAARLTCRRCPRTSRYADRRRSRGLVPGGPRSGSKERQWPTG
jgi:hypothetical protein